MQKVIKIFDKETESQVSRLKSIKKGDSRLKASSSRVPY